MHRFRAPTCKKALWQWFPQSLIGKIFSLRPLTQWTIALFVFCFAFFSPETLAQSASRSAVTSIDGLDIDSNSSTTAANYTLVNSAVEEALTRSRRAVHARPDDMESHLALAEALQQKITNSNERDPYLLEECVQEWLIVLRSEVGEEKGVSLHGINLTGHLFEDEGYALRARQQLVHLVGRAPKPWETDAHYIKSALRSATVVGKVLRRGVSESKVDR